MQKPSPSLSACPDHARLLDLAEGRLADLDAETISLHVAECEDCDERLDRLEEQSDLLIQALAGMPATGEDEEQFQQLQQRLLDNPEPFSTRSESLTATELRDFASNDTLAPIESTLPFELGNYQLLELIGAGAHGAVFHAKHQRLDREVAVKLLLRARGSYLAEFLNEMRIIGQLDHPHIVRATDAGEVDGIYFLAMDYVPGIDVTSLLRRTGPLGVADACEIARQTALGLACAHEHNLVHRDVKTSNLLFSSSGVVKLLDLGLATVPVNSPGQVSTANSETSPTASTLHGPRGTADYMPPEQWTASNLVTDKADLYSLGCTLFKLLTGAPPFKELPPDVSSKQAAHESSPPPTLSTVRSDVPRGLDRLVHQLLAKSPDGRPISASYVAKQLLRFADSADLARLVRSHCPELTALPTPAHIRPNTVQSRVRRIASRVPRRTWLSGAALLTLATAFGLRSRRIDNHEPLNTESWRDLLASQPGSVKINDSLPRPKLKREANGAVALQSESLALQHLGSPLVRPYQWQTTLRRTYPDSASRNRRGRHVGVFFGLQKTDSDNLRFHTFELWRTTEDWRLLWCEYAQPDKIAAPLDLAETVISGVDPNDSLLFEVSIGKSGFPEFSFGGNRLPLSKWNLATEARNLISNNSRELVSLYAGRIGVIHHHGITTTESSRLLYLQN